ncbi:hypothetical protein ACIQPQ_03105 [Streptomyces sp. NPDC091281]|uniref:hypothetical protein n=1 Tax=Streptomyces sp. NPDC091281 TaxID=3365985 RepID=UPI0038168106
MEAFVVLGVLAVAGFVWVLRREVRSARAAIGLERALRTLAERPGWEREDRERRVGGEVMLHFPWLGADRGTAVRGRVGEHRVTLVKLSVVGTRKGLHWLAVFFEVPGTLPSLRLERPWSAERLGLRLPPGQGYLAMGADAEALGARLVGTPLPGRLAALDAPAVSVYGGGGDGAEGADGEVCFLFHPVPRGDDLADRLTALAELLQPLTLLARSSEERQERQERQEQRERQEQPTRPERED